MTSVSQNRLFRKIKLTLKYQIKEPVKSFPGMFRKMKISLYDN